MATRLNSELLEKALKLLAGRLELDGSPPFNMIVCGGSSLIAMGLVVRTTKDVDVVGFIDEANRVTGAKPLPAPLLGAAKRVAADLGLDENWLNPGPADLVALGLPEGFMGRLEARKYGRCLIVNFISRYDQIHFKVYAAIDRGPGYHVDDLLVLKPNEKELEEAANWALTHDTSDGFRLILKDMLRKLGYESVSDKF
ncbi:MAG: hypothetical protein P9M00_01245 [Candidatus Tritonobacter lacicola]|nr:hypothetical protein [Candidatus Tritonobacter lacicola]